jgi:hypothetical protein
VKFSDYIAHGWQLCGLERGKKGPTYKGWNVRPLSAEAADLAQGVGLLHALSGTAALDLDDMSKAVPWLAQHGIDVKGLLEAPDAVMISSGRAGRAKLLYRMKTPKRTLKPEDSGLELRCASQDGKSVQDVLPGSIHPVTNKPYEWVFNDLVNADWRRLPPLPAPLARLWKDLAEPIRTVVEETALEAPAAAAGPSPSPAATIDLGELRKAAFRKSPDAPYDEWLKVGMQLHDGTRGAQEGFDIWAEWSRKVTRIRYPGDAVLKQHWLSFESKPGKTVASAAALVAEIPAEASDFPEADPNNEDPTTADLQEEAERLTKAQALDFLKARLVFVHSIEKYFDVERQKIIMSEASLEHLFGYLLKGSTVAKTLKKASGKQFADAMGFHPGEGVLFKSGDDTFCNSYRNRLPVPLEPTAGELERIEWLFNRIDDGKYREWLRQFYAHVVQKPGVKIKSAPLIWSEIEGNGKSTLCQFIPSLLVGAEYSKEVTSDLLDSTFNDYLLDAWHVNLPEFRAGTRGEREAIAAKLKPWITDNMVNVHPKGLRGYNMPNHFFVTATSNKEDAAAISNQDRRWGIHELRAPQLTEAEQLWLYQGFLLTPRVAGVLRHYFLNVDITDFVPSAKAPDTADRREMIEASLPSHIEMLREAFDQRSEPLERDIVSCNDVMRWAVRNSSARPTLRHIGKVLAKPPFNAEPVRFRVGQGLFRALVIRRHDRWRGASGDAMFAEMNGETIDLLS